LEAEATAREQAYQQRVAAHTTAAEAKGKKPRQLKRRPQETPNPDATANTTDPCSRLLHTHNHTVQGYNAQAVTTMQQLVVAAELTDEANDIHQLKPMLQATATTLAAAGIDQQPETALADSGYWSIDNLTTIPNAPELYIPPARHARQASPARTASPRHPAATGLRAAMTAKLTSEDGKARYAKRRETVEPAFGQIKEQQAARQFLRRGSRARNAEWKLLCGTHNLLKRNRGVASRYDKLAVRYQATLHIAAITEWL
jgi:Transposase DDE domain